MTTGLRASAWLHALVVLGAIAVAFPPLAAAQCSSTAMRTDCGYLGINQTECQNNGCCWSPVNPNPNNEPWCFIPGNPVCDASQARTDCGYTGITQAQCQANGCCWSPLNPNPSNQPWCFYPTAPYASYYVKTLNQNSHGYTGILAINGTTGSRYGKDITPLAFTIEYINADTVHFKIYDPTNPRWEVPNEFIPRPSASASTLNYRVNIQQTPFSIQVTRLLDDTIIWDTSVDSLVFTDQYLEISSALAAAPNVYGLGEHRDPFQLDYQNHIYTMWSRDSPTPVDQNVYGSHPFFLEVRPGGSAHGAFLLNSNGLDVVLNPGEITFRAIGGVLDFYIFDGPNPDQVVQQYHNVIGLPHLPPYWSLGWHQCRYGYPSIQYVEQVVANYSAANIPLETIWNDIDYMDAYMDFTFDPVNYPEAQVAAFVNQLHANAQHYVVIVDPAIHNLQNYTSYMNGLKLNAFIKEADGVTDFVGAVWPGSTVFPDFSNAAVRNEYWFGEIATFLKQVPIDGLWIDMNEPSNFGNGQPTSGSPYNNPPYSINNCGNQSPLNTNTLPMDALQYPDGYNGTGVAHYDLHNLYGFTESIGTRAALETFYKKRAFVLSRSTFAGSGVHTAHWTGDNQSTFSSLQASIRQILNFNLFGIPMVGSDICGFLGDTTEELCARWTALGGFGYMFARNHDDIHSASQEPYRWPSVAQIARTIFAARYSLLPYYYTLLASASTNGGTVTRPLMFEFPTDANTYSIDQQFMIGSALLVTPVVTQGATSVTGYFPPGGRWFSFWDYSSQATGSQTLPAPLNVLPVHIRGGYVIPMQVPAMTINATRSNPFQLLVALDASGSASGSLFQDDGESLDWMDNHAVTAFTVVNGQLTSSAINADYSAAPGLNQITIIGLNSPVHNVTVNGASYSSFSYNSGLGVLTITNLNLSVLSTFSVLFH